MASIRITIETDGAAFHKYDDLMVGASLTNEVVSILAGLCGDLLKGHMVTDRFLQDANGNLVGKVEMID